VRRPVSVIVATAALAIAGCGDDARDIVRETSSKLGDIKSGRLHLRAAIEPRGVHDATVGVQLDGPFALPERRTLPSARIRYTKIAGRTRSTATFTSTPQAGAFVSVGGRTHRLPARQAAPLQVVAGGGLDELGIDLADWMESPRVADGGRVGGTETDLVDGRLDAATALEDVLALTGRRVRMSERLTRALSDATRSSRLAIWTGRTDRLLRRLRLRVEFVVPAQLARLIGGVTGGLLAVDLAISNPNRAVHVSPPPRSGAD
jgi:hypothetical protein